MSALTKLAVAAQVVGIATPTAVMAFIEYESHPGAVALTVSLVAGAAAVVGLSAADEHAAEVARLAAADAAPPEEGGEWNADGTWNEDFVWDGTFTPEAEAEIRANLWRDAALFAAYDTMRQRPATDTPEPYRPVEATPVPPESAAETTRIDPLPEALTHEMPSQEPWTAPAAPAAPWSATGLAFMAVAPQEPRQARHAAPEAGFVSPERSGPVGPDWFRPAQRAGRAA